MKEQPIILTYDGALVALGASRFTSVVSSPRIILHNIIRHDHSLGQLEIKYVLLIIIIMIVIIKIILIIY